LYFETCRVKDSDIYFKISFVNSHGTVCDHIHDSPRQHTNITVIWRKTNGFYFIAQSLKKHVYMLCI